MNKRQSATIFIQRGSGQSTTGVATVPITPQSVRKYHLMTEDCIVLHFALGTARHFKRGDWCDDELFGTFIVREEQMPRYNRTTGGYEYELVMDKAYRQWEDYIFMMTYLEGNHYYRRETSWQLTDSLEHHVDEVVRNVNDLDLEHVGDGWSSEIHTDSCPKAAEIKYISYDGQHILSAMTSIAQAYECEWWVDDVNKVIHFGKCEVGDTHYDMQLGVNVETMDISRNENDYANRIYALGSTRNIPSSYRKRLLFEADAWYTNLIFHDSSKVVTRSMMAGGEEDVHLGLNMIGGEVVYGSGTTTFKQYSVEHLDKAPYTFSGAFNVNPEITFPAAQSQVAYTAELSVLLMSDTTTTLATLYSASQSSSSAFSVSFENIDAVIPSTDYYRLEIRIVITSSEMPVPSANTYVTSPEGGDPSGCITASKGFLDQFALLTFNANDYWVWRRDYEENGVVKHGFSFVSGYLERTPQTPPSGFGSGSEYTLNFHDPTATSGANAVGGLIVTKIPSSWFLDEYDNLSALKMFGERRLRMPASTPPVLSDDYVETTPNTYPVERIAVFDDIYPKCYLKVTDVVERAKTTEQKMEDGSVKRWDWTEYLIKAKDYLSNDDFPFNSVYISDGEKLESVWLSDIDTQRAFEEAYPEGTYEVPEGAQFQLAGMTFAVGYNNADMTYTLVRNKDYGALLPSELVKPSVGDVFVLTGWDVKAMDSLGLISIAESRLAAEAAKYLQAVEEGQFTFTCHMMTDASFEEEPGSTETEEVDITNTGTAVNKKYINGATWASNNNATGTLIGVTPGDTIKLSRVSDNAGANTGVWAWMQANNTSGAAKFAGELTARQKLALNASITMTVPNDAAYLYLYTKTTNGAAVKISAAKIVTTIIPGDIVISLLGEGSRVMIHSDMLKVGVNEDYKLTRVLGYEFKLDMPYDTPKYVCGETDAYSRIKQLEKKITKR